jgi:hypothetical protein
MKIRSMKEFYDTFLIFMLIFFVVIFSYFFEGYPYELRLYVFNANKIFPKGTYKDHLSFCTIRFENKVKQFSS